MDMYVLTRNVILVGTWQAQECPNVCTDIEMKLNKLLTLSL